MAELQDFYHFSEKKLQETLANKPLTETLKALIIESKVTSQSDKAVGNLLYEAASKFPGNAKKHRPFFAQAIARGDITTANQTAEAYKFFKKVGESDFSEADFKTACGVGITVSEEQIENEIQNIFQANEKALEEKKHDNLIPFLKQLREKLKWGDAKVMNEKLNVALVSRLGPKVEVDPKEKKKKKREEEKTKEKEKEKDKKDTEVTLQENIRFYRPEENIQPRPELLEEHLKATGGRVVTRFPPEPNGYLHIGHSKAMNLNFGYAKREGGWCYLRFDDTNPEKESQEYIDSIIDAVRWLGHEPYKITYASDYFDKLYELAEDLIKRGLAFVCHQSVTEIRKSREERRKTGKAVPSPWRDRPIEESLRLFRDMRKGKFEEGKATLRMKQDLNSPNPCMWDTVAYRIKYASHPHVGDKWCIYPSYDFTHCICDSLENITHSMCTLEFNIRRETYDWLLDALDIFRSRQWEYSRLCLTYTVLSKRKLNLLVSEGVVSGWDDPRLATLSGYRRLGFTAAAINNFCESIGITRTQSYQDIEKLEEYCRRDLDVVANRAMAVLEPLKVVITNYPEDKVETITVPNHPTDASKGSHDIKFSRVVYIDRSDFRLTDAPNYFRLAPGKEVRLHHAYNITCTEAITDAKGEVVELRAVYDPSKEKTPKGKVHWVAQPSPGEEPLKAEVRLYERLFTAKYPEGVKKIPKVEATAPQTEAPKKAKKPSDPRRFLKSINPNSLKVATAFVDAHLKDANAEDKFQFERVGFFTVDKDSKPHLLVFNRTVTLKEDKQKDADIKKKGFVEEIYESDDEDEDF